MSEELVASISMYLSAGFDIAFAIIAAASAIAAVTPTPRDEAWVGRVYRIIDMLALNVGHAKEATPKRGGRFVAD